MQARLAGRTGHTLDGLAELLADPRRRRTRHRTASGRRPRSSAEAVAACADRSATWGRANLINEIELRLPVLGTSTPPESRLVLEMFTDLGAGQPGRRPGHRAGRRRRLPGAVLDPLRRRRHPGRRGRPAPAAVERGGHALEAAAVKAWLDEHAPPSAPTSAPLSKASDLPGAALAVLVGPAGSRQVLHHRRPGRTPGRGPATGPGGRVGHLPDRHPGPARRRDRQRGNIAAFLPAQDRLDRAGSRGDARGRSFGDERWRLGPRDVVLVDEASMVATTDLDAIRRRSSAAGARMVLAGDPRQLAAVEAGGVMGLLDGHAETYTLTDIRRFTEPGNATPRSPTRRATPRRWSSTTGTAGSSTPPPGRRASTPPPGPPSPTASTAAPPSWSPRPTTWPPGSPPGSGTSSSTSAMVEADGVALGRDGNTAGIGDLVSAAATTTALGRDQPRAGTRCWRPDRTAACSSSPSPDRARTPPALHRWSCPPRTWPSTSSSATPAPCTPPRA